MSNPMVAVYRHAHRPKFILESWCIHKLDRYTTMWGKLLHLTEQEFMSTGLRLVLDDLAQFPSRDSDVGSETFGTSKEAKKARKARNECWVVHVTQHSDAVLELTLMLDIGKGRGVGSEHRFVIKLPVDSNHFFEAINEAFEHCRVVSW